MRRADLPDPSWVRGLAVLGPPSLLLMLGIWQTERGWSGVMDLSREATQLALHADRVDAIAAVAPDRPVRFDGDPNAYGARQAATMMRDGVAVLRRDVLVDRVRVGVALATVGGGAVSLLAGGAGLAAAAWAARRGRRSPGALAAAFSRIRILLPVLLGGVAGGLALACAAAIVFEVTGWLSATSDAGAGAHILAPGLALAGFVLWLGWSTLRELHRSLAAPEPVPLSLPGRAVTPDAAPGLWRFVAGRAAEQGAAMPDHVVAGLGEGFFVTSAAVALEPDGLLLRGSTLHVPLPLLAMLDAGEVAAIIGHELAHLAGDTGHGLRVLPIRAGVGRTLQALRTHRVWPAGRWARGPAITLGTHVAAVLEGAVRHWDHLREIEADLAGARPGGAEAAGRALLRTALLQPVIDAVLDEAWDDPGAAVGDLVAAAVSLVIGLLLARAAAAPWATDPSDVLTIRLVAGGLVAAAAAATWRAVVLWRLRAAPLVTLYAEGFLCRGLDRMVPWIGVERVNMTGRRSTHVFIHLKDTTRLPRRVSGWRVLVHRRRRVVTMLAVRPRGLSPDAFAGLVHRYWAAAAARAALAGEEPGYSMILSEEEMQGLLDGDA